MKKSVYEIIHKKKCRFRDVFFFIGTFHQDVHIYNTAVNGLGSLIVKRRKELFYTHNISYSLLSYPSDFLKHQIRPGV